MTEEDEEFERIAAKNRQHVNENQMIKYDDYDEAIIGPAYIWRDKTQVEVLVYDAEQIKEILIKRNGMSSEEAREFIEFNIEGGYLGLHTPVLVWKDSEWNERDYDEN